MDSNQIICFIIIDCRLRYKVFDAENNFFYRINWYFRENRAGGKVSFSASTEVNAVAEPATMFLPGSGLIWIVAWDRRKKSKDKV